MLVQKFTCSPWVQNLHWVADKGVLILIQNQVEGRRWRFTFLDLAKSVATGREQVLRTVDVDKSDEMEGFTLLGDDARGLAVTSSRHQKAHYLRLTW